MSRLLSFALLTVVLVGVSYAQNASTGTLVGTARDATGAIAPNARVKATNLDTQFLSETISGSEGNYTVPYLAPGNYRLTVEAAGFKTFTQEGIALRAGETPRIDVGLQVGAQTENVTVTANAPLLQTETAQSGTTYDGETIQRIPVPAKRTMRALFFFPNTSGTRILGQRQADLAFTLDGISGKAPGLPDVGNLETSATVQGAPEAYEEVKVLTVGTPAEVGHASGGTMALIFKSGTNAFHGSGEIRWQDQPMQHRAWLQQLRLTVPYSYGEYTAAVSGPVVFPKIYNGHDKTFFLATWTLQDEKFNTTYNTDVPSLAALNGDFSFPAAINGGYPIYDPFTTRLVNGAWTRDQFPGNIVPKNRWDPAVVKFLSYTPWAAPTSAGSATRTGPTQNFQATSARTKQTYRHRMDFKIDHQITANNRLSVRVSPTVHHADRDNPQPKLTFNGDGSIIDPNQQPFPLRFWNFLIADVHVVSPTMTNELRFGGNHRKQEESVNSVNEGWAAKLGIPNVSPVLFPYLNAGYGLSQLSNRHTGGDDFVLQDNVTKVLRKHTLKFGWETTRTWYNSTTADQPSGIFNFGGTDFPFQTNTGQGFASFLLGSVSSAQFTQSFASWLPRWWSEQGFIQDDWKPFRTVTVNLGLRWSYESPFSTKYGQQSQFDPNATDTLTGMKGALLHTPGLLSKRDLNNFAPRVGVAWNVIPRAVFRTSFGIIHSDVFMANTEGINFQEYQGVVNLQQNSGDPRPIFRLSDGPPSFAYPVTSGGYAPYVGTNYSSRNVDWYDPNMRLPYVMSWSAGLQYELKHNYLLELQYSGQAGVGLVNTKNINQIPLSVYKTDDLATLNTIYANQQIYKPYPQFGTVRLISNFAHNTYHAGNIRLERRYNSGFTWNAFYTWSKTLTDADGSGGSGGVDYYNQRLDKGPAGYDIRHRFVGLMQYSLPFGKGRRWFTKGFADKMLGGFDFTWSQTLQSGTPFSIGVGGSSNRELSGGGTQRPNIITANQDALTPGWNGVGENRYPFSAQVPYLRDTAFAYPAAFTVGNLGKNTFTGPGTAWMVTSLVKWFNLGERRRFQIGLDGLNLPWKQPNYSNPSTTWNSSSNQNFGRITGYSIFNQVGSSQANWQLRGRYEW